MSPVDRGSNLDLGSPPPLPFKVVVHGHCPVPLSASIHDSAFCILGSLSCLHLSPGMSVPVLISEVAQDHKLINQLDYPDRADVIELKLGVRETENILSDRSAHCQWNL